MAWKWLMATLSSYDCSQLSWKASNKMPWKNSVNTTSAGNDVTTTLTTQGQNNITTIQGTHWQHSLHTFLETSLWYVYKFHKCPVILQDKLQCKSHLTLWSPCHGTASMYKKAGSCTNILFSLTQKNTDLCA